MSENLHGGAALSGTVEEDRELALLARESARYATARWPAGWEAASKRPYQMCTRTVMDTTDPELTFDADGACSWVHRYEAEVRSRRPSPEQCAAALERCVADIKAAGSGSSYDSVIGLSGGVDSSYLCLLAVELGLRPLVVHFDNGWNSELAVQNIERIVTRLKLDLHTFVMDWPEFRDLQRSYFRASVLDLEIPTDHMIFGAMYHVASKHRIKYILSGANSATEWLLPPAWYYSKFDLANIEAIQREYGTRKLKKLPALGVAQSAWYHQVRRLRQVQLLESIDYDKRAAKQRLIADLGWRDYGGKHHESIFTRFYQGYILPRKFNIDKRKAHLSNLVLAGQATRAEAIEELLRPPYDERLQREDFSFVAKKLGFSEAELEDLLSMPNRSHGDFANDRRARAVYRQVLVELAPVKAALRPFAKLVPAKFR